MSDEFPDYNYFEEVADMPAEMDQERKAREHMKQALQGLASCRSSRENSLAITNLEQALMWSRADEVKKGLDHAFDQPD